MDFFGNDGLSRIRWTFPVCSMIRCVYRAELILGRYFTYCLRKLVLKYELIKVRYLNVPWTPIDSDGTCENSPVSEKVHRLYPPVVDTLLKTINTFPPQFGKARNIIKNKHATIPQLGV